MTFWTMPMLLARGGGLKFVSSASASVFSGTLTVDKPAGVLGGDHMIAMVWAGSSMTSLSLTGWSSVGSLFTGNARYAIFRRIADGSEGSSFSFTGTTGVRNGIIVAYRGGAGLVDVLGAATIASGDTSTAASLTAAQKGILVSSFALISSGFSVTTPPSGMVQRGFENSFQSAAIYELAPSPAGATGAKTLVWPGASNNGGIQLQIY